MNPSTVSLLATLALIAGMTPGAAVGAGLTSILDDPFEAGISSLWDVTTASTHQSSLGGGANGTDGYAAVGAEGGLGESFGDAAPGGTTNWSVSFYFRWSATANRKFAFHVSTLLTGRRRGHYQSQV